jgi:peroxiredoxin
MRSPKNAVPILICAAAVTAGCGGSADPPEGGEPAPAGFSATLTSAPEFRLESVAGGEVALSDSNGKVRLIDFWATWCAPCVEEIPMLQELHAKYRDQGFEILAISEEEAEILAEFVDEHDIGYPNLVGTAGVAQSYRVLGLPSAFLVDGEGRIVERWQGPKPAKVLEEKIRGLLGPA